MEYEAKFYSYEVVAERYLERIKDLRSQQVLEPEDFGKVKDELKTDNE